MAPQTDNPEQRAREARLQSVIIPLAVAVIGAGATLAAPLVAPSSSSGSTVSPKSVINISSSGGVTLPSTQFNSHLVECAIYEVQVLAPLARTDPKLAETLMNSPISRKCGLSP